MTCNNSQWSQINSKRSKCNGFDSYVYFVCRNLKFVWMHLIKSKRKKKTFNAQKAMHVTKNRLKNANRKLKCLNSTVKRNAIYVCGIFQSSIDRRINRKSFSIEISIQGANFQLNVKRFDFNIPLDSLSARFQQNTVLRDPFNFNFNFKKNEEKKM